MSRHFKTLLIAALFAGLPVTATAEELLRFNIDNHPMDFVQDDARNLLISASCKTSGGGVAEFRCKAHDALKAASLQGVRKFLKGGKNPGSVVCARALKAQVVMGIDANKNQISFCKFSDGSLLDNGSLAHYARANDARK